MTPKAIEKAAAECLKRIRQVSEGKAERYPDGLPFSFSFSFLGFRIIVARESAVLRHCRYLLESTSGLIEDRHLEKAQRWLACSQGILLLFLGLTIRDLKTANKPEGDPYDKDA
jgi:hypothetical protein